MEVTVTTESGTPHLTSSNNHEYIPPVYAEKTIITVQPHNGEGRVGLRNPIPVATVSGWDENNTIGSYIPLTGLQFLAGVEQLDIQQTVELHHLLARIESEKRYVLRTRGGETVFVGAEQSSTCQRLCCGSARGFSLSLVDPTQQLAATFQRPSTLLPCLPQKLYVYVPPGDILGTVTQDWTLLTPTFTVKDECDRKLYSIKGPRICTCAMYKDATFQVLDGDDGRQVASISHTWEHTLVNYNLCLTFPSYSLENKHKALLIGAAFLLEYMYFERAKNTRCFNCC